MSDMPRIGQRHRAKRSRTTVVTFDAQKVRDVRWCLSHDSIVEWSEGLDPMPFHCTGLTDRETRKCRVVDLWFDTREAKHAESLGEGLAGGWL